MSSFLKAACTWLTRQTLGWAQRVWQTLVCWEGGGSGLWSGVSWVLRVSWSNDRLAEPRLCARNIAGRALSPHGAVGPPMVAPGLQSQEDSWEGGQSPGVRVAGLRAGGGAHLAAHFTATWPLPAGPGGRPAASPR